MLQGKEKSLEIRFKAGNVCRNDAFDQVLLVCMTEYNNVN